MKILFVFISTMAITLFASAEGIKFVKHKTWKETLTQAKKENKLIFLDAYATWCGPCKYMQKDVFPVASLGAYFNKTFINVKMDMEEGEGPQLAEQFKLTAYPTLYFINGDGEIVHKSVGGINASDLLALGKEAVDPEKQYYTLKKAAEKGTLSPDLFLNWLQQAEKMEDDDINDLVYAYLNLSTHNRSSKEMLLIMLEHGSSIPKKDLDYLYKNKAIVLKTTGHTEREFINSFTDKAVDHAFKNAIKDQDLDFSLFSASLQPYAFINTPLQTQIMRVRYYAVKDDTTKTLSALSSLLSDYNEKLDAFTMVSLVYDQASAIVEKNKTDDFLKKINKYQLKPEEREKVYYKNLALLSIYYYLKTKEKITEYAALITTDPNAPLNIKRMAEKMKEGS